MTHSRTRNTLLSSSVGLVVQAVSMLLSFAVRSIFIHHLSLEYLGINGLYSNILTLLSLSELGMSNVMIFSLYKPVAQKDEKKICQLLTFYNRLYLIVALGVLGLGMALLPFLQYLVKSELSLSNLRIYYVLFLLNSVCSYFVVYKSVLLKADQKLHITKTINLIGLFIKSGLQIIAITVFNSYIFYLLSQIICVLVENVTLSAVTTRKYPFIRNKLSLPKQEQGELYRNIGAAFLFRVGTTIVNNTDNILISVLVSTIAVGYYSNYAMVVTAVTGILSIFTSAVIPSVGNLNADADKKRSVEMAYVFTLFYHFISAFCAICFFFLLDRFILVWLGKAYIVDHRVVAAIVVNFFVSFVITPIWMYREACGLFTKVKFLMLYTAVANLIFSVFGGIKFGVAGIIFATAFARIVTTVWYEPIVLFQKHFGVSVWGYWKRQGSYLLLSVLSFLLCGLVDGILPGGFLFVPVRGVLFGIVCFGVFGIFTHKTKEYRYLNSALLRARNKRKKGK